jgi:hypothetical protein
MLSMQKNINLIDQPAAATIHGSRVKNVRLLGARLIVNIFCFYENLLW